MENKIIAVVVTYNREKLLVECLHALKAQNYPLNRVIVIDNHSTDGTAELFKENKEFDDTLFDYQFLPRNIGGAGGFHEGMKRASSLNPDWIWVMDDDTIPYPDSLEQLIRAGESLNQPKISFIASSVFGPGQETMNVPVISKERASNGYADWYTELGNGLVKIDSATFVSLLFNNQAVQKIGLPFTDYFIWGDDTEYTLRMTRYFGPAFFSGKSKVLHKRIGVKNLSIENEETAAKIPLYFYLVRNTLITRTEYFGKKTGIRDTLLWTVFSFFLLVKPAVKFRLKKVFVVQKGILAFLFRRYNRKAFANRMSVH